MPQNYRISLLIPSYGLRITYSHPDAEDFQSVAKDRNEELACAREKDEPNSWIYVMLHSRAMRSGEELTCAVEYRSSCGSMPPHTFAVSVSQRQNLQLFFQHAILCFMYVQKCSDRFEVLNHVFKLSKDSQTRHGMIFSPEKIG